MTINKLNKENQFFNQSQFFAMTLEQTVLQTDTLMLYFSFYQITYTRIC